MKSLPAISNFWVLRNDWIWSGIYRRKSAKISRANVADGVQSGSFTQLEVTGYRRGKHQSNQERDLHRWLEGLHSMRPKAIHCWATPQCILGLNHTFSGFGSKWICNEIVFHMRVMSTWSTCILWAKTETCFTLSQKVLYLQSPLGLRNARLFWLGVPPRVPRSRFLANPKLFPHQVSDSPAARDLWCCVARWCFFRTGNLRVAAYIYIYTHIYIYIYL